MPFGMPKLVRHPLASPGEAVLKRVRNSAVFPVRYQIKRREIKSRLYKGDGLIIQQRDAKIWVPLLNIGFSSKCWAV